MPNQYTSLPMPSRLWSQTTYVDDCRVWTGYTNNHGYGSMRLKGKWVFTHRLAWELINGPIPNGLWVLHHCDNPPCLKVDPDPSISHLFLGTPKDNAQDMLLKGRHISDARPDLIPRGEARGRSKLTDEIVRDIRRRYSGGAVIYKDLAIEFGVAISTVRKVICHETWTHVA